MIDHDKLHAQRTNGAQADIELRQTGDAFEQLRQQYVDAWMASDPRDTAGREKLFLATTILTKVQQHLRASVANGRIAAKQIEDLQKAGEPKKKVLGLV